MVVGIEGYVGESKVRTSDVSVRIKLFVQDGKESVEFGAKLRDLGAIRILASVHLKLELSNNVGDRRCVRLVNREPLLDKSPFLEVRRRVQEISLVLVCEVANDGSRFVKLEVTVDENRDLAERLKFGEVVSRFDGGHVDHLELVGLPQFLQRGRDGAAAR